MTKERKITAALEKAKEAAVEAGKVILEVYHSDFHVEEKEDHSPVTEADLKANECILKRLKSAFPECAFLAEESRDDLSRRENPWCFIIDPLDGTKEFVKRSDEFTVNIALVYKERPVMGVVYVPVTGHLYYAMKGCGAYFEGDGEKRQIHVSDRVEDIRAAVSKSNSPANIGEILKGYGIHNIIFAGSSIKGCLIAEGKAEIYYRGGRTCEWDTAAMQCIVEEAGGILRQLDDTEMTYNRENVVNEKGFYILNTEKNKIETYSEKK